MSLTDSQKQQASSYLAKNTTISKCPACDKKGAAIAGQIALPAIIDGSMNLNATIPAVVLICEKCGHISLFNSEILGI